MIRRLRLLSGLVMLSYVTMHLLNHAIGLVSLGAMEDVLWYVAHLWGSPPGLGLLLYGAFLVHYGLALYALWERRSLKLRGSELAQIVLGFLVPILLVRHVVNTRLAASLYDADTRHYSFLLWVYFVRAPERGFVQLLVLVVAWMHAMIGLHFWLKVRPWYARVEAQALVIAVLVPTLALLGAIAGGRQVRALAAAPGWRAALAQMALPGPAAAQSLDQIGNALGWFFVAAVAAVLLARLMRREWHRRRGLVRIAYPDGRSVDVVAGTSVLEASRQAGIPHAAVCGGRGRCSTCRIRVRAEPHAIDPPGEAEARVLSRIGATPNIRLACQLRPHGNIAVTPLLPPLAAAQDGLSRVDFAHGSEREIAILFADIRGFTGLAEGRLPYDVVFILNRYFAAMGRAVEQTGGRVDKFIGDGLMALFGIDSGTDNGCRTALAAARLMAGRLDELNRALAGEIEAPLRIGIGIHVGPVIVGEIGYGAAATLTAIGDAVNIASRLEALTKEYGCQLVVSDAVVGRAGTPVSGLPRHAIEVRGRREMLLVYALESAADLPQPAAAGAPKPAAA